MDNFYELLAGTHKKEIFGVVIMLPDTLELLQSGDRDAFLALLAMMAKADGLVTEEESAFWSSRICGAMLEGDDKKRMLDRLNSVEYDESILENMTKDHLKSALREILFMSAIDGFYDAREIDLIKVVATKAGVSDSSLEKMFEWVERGQDWISESTEILNS